MTKTIAIVFDKPPGPEAPRFIEVEDSEGKSISIGEWVQNEEYWDFVIPDPREIQTLEADNAALRAEVGSLEDCLVGARRDIERWHLRAWSADPDNVKKPEPTTPQEKQRRVDSRGKQ